jgi:hypothetical protein
VKLVVPDAVDPFSVAVLLTWYASVGSLGFTRNVTDALPEASVAPRQSPCSRSGVRSLHPI